MTMAHRTTWTSNKNPTFPRTTACKNKKNKNLNQGTNLNQAQDARSYSGVKTSPDHELVKAPFNIKWYKIKYNKPEMKIKTERLRENNIGKAFHYKPRIALAILDL